ncbi:MAG TPA: S8 family serine peptidase [Gemmataceae bacterium]|nr:S8 family serine peptidase [Gemmataceae bacterium]
MGRTSNRTARTLYLESLEDRTLLDSGAGSGASHILVRFVPGVTPAAVLRGTAIGAPVSGLVPGLYQVDLSGSVTVAQALAAYKADPQVLTAEPDYQLTVSGVPNDPNFAGQWDMLNTGQNGGTPGADIHATGAWNVTTSAGNVVVAVLDTGIDYAHPDLYQNIWINQAEIPKSRLKNLVDVDHDGYISFADLNNPINQGPGKITDVNHNGRIDAGDILAPMVVNAQGQDTGLGGWAYAGNTQDGDTAHPNDFIGWNFALNNNNPLDGNGHGTNVAGVIGATGNNAVGVAGVDWNVRLMDLQFLNAHGNGSTSGLINALNYAVQHGAKITNNSWDGALLDQSLSAAIANARSAGQIFVVAAGNGASSNDKVANVISSATFDNIVSVAASDNKDNLANFTNYGPHTVDLAAPGVNILSTQPGGGYTAWTGTSQATPHVTGVLALVWAEHPTWSYAQVIHQVLSTVDKLPSMQGKLISGGRLDAAAAVGNVTQQPTPQVTGSSAGGPATNELNDIRVTVNVALDPASFSPAAVSLTGPGGQAIAVSAVQPVAGAGNRAFDVIFPTQTAAGTYTLKLGPPIHDTTGKALAAYQTAFAVVPYNTYTTAAAVPIRPSTWSASVLTVADSVTIGSVAVRVNLSYPRDGDLTLYLQAPDGTLLTLAARRGDIGPNFQGTLFDDGAALSVASGKAPFAGAFRPESSLAALAGKNVHGQWKLWVVNSGSPLLGMVTSWSLVVIPAQSGGVHAASVSAADGVFTSADEMGRFLPAYLATLLQGRRKSN